MDFNPDQVYMDRCFTLARKGLGFTYPNPMVGAVIVYDNAIIGEGWHHGAGLPHAEINALRQVKNKKLLKQSTLYVSLEPCSHFGKTPPCVNAILAHKIPKIVIAMSDPHVKVAGKGIKKLQDAGCEVVLNILEKEALALNKRFICFHQKQRPYIILKWAESLDGFIAPTNAEKGKVHWISNAASRQLVHQWRSEEEAILIGVQTVIDDNPALTTRSWAGNHPKRFIIDPNGRLPGAAGVITDKHPTIIFSKKTRVFDHPLKKTIQCSTINLKIIIEKLTELQIQSIIIEGGQKTLQSFLNEGLWDEARVIRGINKIGNGIKAPMINSLPKTSINIGGDQFSTYYPKD